MSLRPLRKQCRKTTALKYAADACLCMSDYSKKLKQLCRIELRVTKNTPCHNWFEANAFLDIWTYLDNWMPHAFRWIFCLFVGPTPFEDIWRYLKHQFVILYLFQSCCLDYGFHLLLNNPVPNPWHSPCLMATSAVEGPGDLFSLKVTWSQK